MKQITLVIFFCFISLTILAQDQDKVTALIKEGIALHDAAKYQDAIAKYKEALQLDPDNAQANYEIAFTLFNTNAGKEAIPYLNKIVAGKSTIVVSAYDMLGSIYDMDNQADKAIEYFKLGIKADPNYQRIYFNLAVTYSRNGKNEEAVENITRALKLLPGHASSHNVYAVTASNNSNSKIKSLYAYCNFLILEANSARSASAYNALKAILNSGTTKKDGVNNITLGMDEKDADLNAANLLISMSGISAGSIPNTTDPDKFELQLKTIFSGIGKISEKKKDKDFFWSFYADYFYKLSQTEFMPLVARIISFSANKDENGKWIKEHEQQLKDFSKWMSTESIRRS